MGVAGEATKGGLRLGKTAAMFLEWEERADEVEEEEEWVWGTRPAVVTGLEEGVGEEEEEEEG